MTTPEAKGRPVGGAPAASGPLVSVVVPTYQVAKPLEACLRSVKEQQYENIELVVVDNNSTDGSLEVANRYADRVIVAGPERSAQRNTGIENSTGEWILWIDSDMVLPPTTIGTLVSEATKEDATALYVLELPVGEGFWTECRSLEFQCYWDRPEIQAPRFVRRAWFEEHGAFSTALTGTEDADLRNRLIESGATMKIVRHPIYHDEGRIRLGRVARKRYYYGKSLPAFRRMQPGAMGGQAGATFDAYLKQWRRLLADPAHAIGLVILRSVEVAAWGLGAAIGELEYRRTVGGGNPEADPGAS